MARLRALPTRSSIVFSSFRFFADKAVLLSRFKLPGATTTNPAGLDANLRAPTTGLRIPAAAATVRKVTGHRPHCRATRMAVHTCTTMGELYSDS
mmetsp:Transcript_4777/g.8416  ORF Transcript_4777/g.8416 Transcript_4777/m.8416 type:complete len:95 (-) Transcript_4777:87-371(-)